MISKILYEHVSIFIVLHVFSVQVNPVKSSLQSEISSTYLQNCFIHRNVKFAEYVLRKMPQQHLMHAGWIETRYALRIRQKNISICS